MGEYKEFTGKTLDSAIKDACAFFNVEREKLEIEIVNDAKSGIFGLVGAKKATIRARKVSLDNIGLALGVKNKGGKGGQEAREKGEQRERGERGERGNRKNGRGKKESAPEAGREAPRASRHQAQEGKKQPPAGSLASRRAADPAFVQASTGEDRPEAAATTPATPEQAKQAEQAEARPGRSENSERNKNSRGRGRNGNREKGENAEKGRGRQRDAKKPAAKAAKSDSEAEGRQARNQARNHAKAQANPENETAPMDDESAFEEQLPVIPLEELDQELLRSTVMETLASLTLPLAGETQNEFMLEEGRVRVSLESGEHQGLLIGRDGQTLAALQYLLTCITSRKLGASVRVQIDAGDYREKQDEKLRSLALNLAQKVKNTQRPQSTRPLSAYHRRIIHLTLQDDPDVQTHSKSEGPLKSVVIVPRRKSAK